MNDMELREKLYFLYDILNDVGISYGEMPEGTLEFLKVRRLLEINKYAYLKWEGNTITFNILRFESDNNVAHSARTIEYKRQFSTTLDFLDSPNLEAYMAVISSIVEAMER